jgi:hypothetical protein
MLDLRGEQRRREFEEEERRSRNSEEVTSRVRARART